MTIGRFVTMPPGFRWPASARVRMPRVDISRAAQNLARVCLALGAGKVFDPTDYKTASRTVVDRLDGTTWSPADPYGAAHERSKIGNRAALTFVTNAGAAGSTRRIMNPVTRPAGSFAVVLEWQASAAATNDGAAPALISNGPANAFYLNGKLNLTCDGNRPAVETSIGAGAHVGAMSYNAGDRTLTWIDENGVVAGLGTYDPPEAGRWALMGNFADGRDLAGQLGMAITFPRALHDIGATVGSIAEPGKAVIDAMRALSAL